MKVELKCFKCVYKSVCRGILNSYFEEFGDRGINPVNFYEAKMVLDELKLKTLKCM